MFSRLGLAVSMGEFKVEDSGIVGKTVKFPQTTVSLNYLFNQITHTWAIICDLLLIYI